MNFLFVHNNFPGQFGQVSRILAQSPTHKVFAIGTTSAGSVTGVETRRYSPPSFTSADVHPFARRFEQESRRAEQVLYILSELISRGFVPDTVVAHCGWGETLPLRAVLPNAHVVTYCEFYYRSAGLDVGFDSEFPSLGNDGVVGLHARNASTLLALAESNSGLTPTKWQKSTFPKEFQPKLNVIHEGVDTNRLTANPHAIMKLPNGATLAATDEVVTFSARNLEPIRGYHIFMRALPKVLRDRPNAHVIIIGNDGVSYGAQPPLGTTWKKHFFDEVRHEIDLNRVHYLGPLKYNDYITALQISSAHVYLTYPFVLSWSMLEAMSCECLVVGSDTGPVREVINGYNGILVPFFNIESLANTLIKVLSDQSRYRFMRKSARSTVVNRYDTATVSLPKMLEFLRAA